MRRSNSDTAHPVLEVAPARVCRSNIANRVLLQLVLVQVWIRLSEPVYLYLEAVDFQASNFLIQRCISVARER